MTEPRQPAARRPRLGYQLRQIATGDTSATSRARSGFLPRPDSQSHASRCISRARSPAHRPRLADRARLTAMSRQFGGVRGPNRPAPNLGSWPDMRRWTLRPRRGRSRADLAAETVRVVRGPPISGALTEESLPTSPGAHIWQRQAPRVAKGPTRGCLAVWQSCRQRRGRRGRGSGPGRGPPDPS